MLYKLCWDPLAGGSRGAGGTGWFGEQRGEARSCKGFRQQPLRALSQLLPSLRLAWLSRESWEPWEGCGSEMHGEPEGGCCFHSSLLQSGFPVTDDWGGSKAYSLSEMSRPAGSREKMAWCLSTVHSHFGFGNKKFIVL